MLDHPNKEFPSKDILISDFKWYMDRHRESFNIEQFERRMQQGPEVLGRYYDAYLPTFNKVVTVEQAIRGVTINGVPLKGKLDKLEFNGKQVTVVDYKTGDPDNAKKKFTTPDEKHPHGGDYWRQAVFYKLLVDHFAGKGWVAIETRFEFVEPDNKKNYTVQKVVIQPQDLATVKAQLTHVWAQIQARNFYTGCGKPDCDSCNFVKDNKLEIALHEEEEMDASLPDVSIT
jgi:DNA helicase-2/ATP-dependent DNA helicase PcrA